jgi:ATP-dependent DNA helicase DinG
LSSGICEQIFPIIDDIKSRGFEEREGQEDLMLDISESFDSGENYMCEAGVGIGKSLAYLIPGILKSRSCGKPLIVCSSTIQLTEQLEKDVSLVSNLLDCLIETVVGKGAHNYPCLERIVNLNDSIGKNNSDIQQLYSYVLNNDVDKQNISPEFKQYMSKISTEKCTYSRCPSRDNCTFFQMRKALKESCRQDCFGNYIPKVIIVNQDLMIRHFMKLSHYEAAILTQNPCGMIIDEAHNLEEKVRAAHTVELNLKDITRFFQDTIKLLHSAYNYEEDRLIQELEAGIKDIFNIEEYRLSQADQNSIGETARLTFHYKDTENLDRYLNLINSISSSIQFIDARGKQEEFQQEVMSHYRHLHNMLSALQNEIQATNILWGELVGKKKELKFCFAPKSTDLFIREGILNQKYPVILVSATITEVGKRGEKAYKYFAKNIGFQGIFGEAKDSPFPYDENARLLLPQILPDYQVRNEIYYEKISNWIMEIHKVVNSGTLVLFTAKQDLHEVAKKVKNSKGTTVYVDSENTSPKTIITQFKETGGIILATGSFWEGIDLPGKELQCVIIVRLPFPVQDPVLEYKIQQNGGMNTVILPEMITKLKQGSGRLIRKEADTGVLVILDSRMNLDAYKNKQIILDALPIKKQLTNIDQVKHFFGK